MAPQGDGSGPYGWPERLRENRQDGLSESCTPLTSVRKAAKFFQPPKGLNLSLALPLVDRDQDWRAHGLCSGTDADLWFSVGAIEHKEAKRICRRCPVQSECLAYAMEVPVDHGIWGGLTERERRRFRRTARNGDWRAAVMAR